jgi:hypothetical protein
MTVLLTLPPGRSDGPEARPPTAEGSETDIPEAFRAAFADDGPDERTAGRLVWDQRSCCEWWMPD